MGLFLFHSCKLHNGLRQAFSVQDVEEQKK